MDGFHIDVGEFRNPAGSNAVLLSLNVGGRGASSGVAVREPAYFVVHVERGMATFASFCRDPEEALQATGWSQ